MSCLYGGGDMATVVRSQRRKHIRQNTTARAQASFFRSQLILFNSRKRHGLLYSVATAAGLFCIPGILSVMGSETEIQLLIQRTIPLPFITLMITVGMFILNDLIDVDLDKANSKNRPIPSGLVSKKQAWSFIILTNGAAVGMLMVTLDLAAMILVMPMMLIGILYSTSKIAFMNRFVLKNIAIALFYMLCTTLGVTSSYGIDLAINDPIVPIHAMVMSGIMIFVGSIINDLGDTKGDNAAGRRTIPIVLGGENTIKMLVILLLSMPAISWMLYATFVEHDTISVLTPIAVTIVASLALLRMINIWKVFEDMELMRKQYKKWFPLYMVLQSGLVVGALLLL
jgi:geranylgeranylglycerol-phosphate geranylgeranyltransferase